MIWTISSFDTAKNLEEPEWKKYGTPLQSCKKDVEWMDIGLNGQSQ